MTKCCLHCAHFAKYDREWFGTSGVCSALSPSEYIVIDTLLQNKCDHFRPRPVEELISDRLSGTYTGKTTPRPKADLVDERLAGPRMMLFQCIVCGRARASVGSVLVGIEGSREVSRGELVALRLSGNKPHQSYCPAHTPKDCPVWRAVWEDERSPQ